MGTREKRFNVKINETVKSRFSAKGEYWELWGRSKSYNGILLILPIIRVDLTNSMVINHIYPHKSVALV